MLASRRQLKCFHSCFEHSILQYCDGLHENGQSWHCESNEDGVLQSNSPAPLQYPTAPLQHFHSGIVTDSCDT